MDRITDFHTHIFPDGMAKRAMAVLSEGGGGIPYYTDGCLESLRKSMKSAGISRSVVMNIATKPSQMKSVNDFAAEADSADAVCFGSVHPDAPDALDELDRIRDLGLKGIKFHLDCQHFSHDHPALKRIYEKAAALGLIVCFHTGYDMSTAQSCMTPARMLEALEMLEGTAVIAAHFGAYAMWEQSLELLCGKNLYFDTSFSCGRMPPGVASEMIRIHGADRILFGSDSPWGSQENEAGFVRLLDIDSKEKEKILYGNADRLLGGLT